MRSALRAVLTRLPFPLEDEDLGVQDEHFRQGLFELPAVVHTLTNRIDPLRASLRIDALGERRRSCPAYSRYRAFSSALQLKIACFPNPSACILTYSLK